MNRDAKIILIWLAALAVGLCCAPVDAQQSADAAAEQLAPETNPAVLAALELPRAEPSDYVSAILALVDLGRPELALPILQELQGQNLSEAQRAELVDEFGTQRMMRLARAPVLAPAGREFADACLAAAANAARNPERLQQLIDKLADPSPEMRHAARVDLASAGMPGTVAAVEAFGRETDASRRAAIAAALVQMHPQVVGPLLGMLATEDAQLKADVVRLLEALQVAPALPLVAVARASDSASQAEAERVLANAIRRYQQGTLAFVPDEDNEVELWSWTGDKLESQSFPADEAQTIWSARLAVALSQLRPENAAYRQQAILLGLEAGGSPRDALGNPFRAVSPFADLRAVPRLLQQTETEELNGILADALGHDYARSATAAAWELLARGDKSVLYSSSPQLAPLVAALKFPDQNVRFAALRSIVQLQPESPFPGSSRVAETLGYFARATGQPSAVVAMPRVERAANVAGRLQTAGIDAAATNRGAEAVRLAQLSPDVQFVLVDMDIQMPGVRDVLYALRIDPATGHMPIGLLAGEGRLAAAQALADEHDRVLAFARPHSGEKTAAMAERLLALAGHNATSPDERAARSKRAIAWMGQLLADGPRFYDLHRQADVIEAAALRSEISSESIAALAALGTPAGQRTLADLASLQTIPIDTRRAAAEAFGQSVQQHGLLLTSVEILGQYDRYNASASADAATQQVLGAVLNAIELERNNRQTPSPAP